MVRARFRVMARVKGYPDPALSQPRFDDQVSTLLINKFILYEAINDSLADDLQMHDQCITRNIKRKLGAVIIRKPK